jgi:hypothetical protein
MLTASQNLLEPLELEQITYQTLFYIIIITLHTFLAVFYFHVFLFSRFSS